MKTYLNALKFVLDHGTVRKDRTGTGTIGVFGMQQRYDLGQGFPAVTTKKLAFNACLSELLWFIEGSGDENRLREILHGSRNSEKSTIWTANATATYWTPKAKFDGDLGRVYGVQWRHWRSIKERGPGTFKDDFGSTYKRTGDIQVNEVDQLKNLIKSIKEDPYSRRHILSAWNVGDMDQMALPPCHVMSQFYVNKDNELSCHMYQRSVDVFLGLPFNIASYALLTHMIAHVCGLKVGELIISTGDTHIYTNHVDQVKEQMTRQPFNSPTLWLNPDVAEIDKFTMDDIKLLDYQSHGPIKAEMAV